MASVGEVLSGFYEADQTTVVLHIVSVVTDQTTSIDVVRTEIGDADYDSNKAKLDSFLSAG